MKNVEYDEALCLIEEYNKKEYSKAEKAYQKSKIAELFQKKGQCAASYLSEHIEGLKKGEEVLALDSYYVKNILIELLSADAVLTHPSWGIEEDADPTDMKLDADDYINKLCLTFCDTDASREQRQLEKLMLDYAGLGIAMSKAVNSAAVYDWAAVIDLIMRVTDGLRGMRQAIPVDVCERIFDLERKAADRLRLDNIIAGIEPFRPKPARGTVRKSGRKAGR